MIREQFLVGLICAITLPVPALCKESARELLIAARDAAMSIPTVEIPDRSERTIALADIAGAFCLAGDVTAAKETAAEIEENFRSFAIARIACAQAYLGDLQAALTTARHGPTGPVWIAYVEMARVCCK